ncbi:orotidine-5'-phosphate decarboxylase [Patescibacteria group bacterium]|nr:orotidine-5'-phosphate decarboxylase [Patescibacteria group bacterium]
MLTYWQRAQKCQNRTAKKLLQLIDNKKTNLAFGVDVTTKDKLLELADKIGPEICVLKTHIDIVEDFDPSVTTGLSELAQKHNFLIFEDRKFADIGQTVEKQYSGGVYKIVDWADIVNAHSVAGQGIVDGLRKVIIEKGSDRGVLLLGEMSSAGNLATGEYTKKTVEMAQANQDVVIGFISMGELVENEPYLINFTPGVKLQAGDGELKQQYNTPESVMAGGTDIIIVGGGIYKADDPLAEAKKYRTAGWQAYQTRLTM